MFQTFHSPDFGPPQTKVSAYFEVLARALQHADRPAVLEHLRATFKIFLEALDLVKVDEEVSFWLLPSAILAGDSGLPTQAETRIITAFKELVVQLNEAAFKPLFRRLYDWAFVEKSSVFPQSCPCFYANNVFLDDDSRKVAFSHLYMGLLDFFKVNHFKSFPAIGIFSHDPH
jgi:U3 small nucleolar RNA-associated protein 10